jgi:hypothetical protein
MYIKYIDFSLQSVSCLSVAHTLLIQKMFTERVYSFFCITLHEHIYRFECSQPYQALTYFRFGTVTAALKYVTCLVMNVPDPRSSKVSTHDYSSILRQLIFDTRNMLYF